MKPMVFAGLYPTESHAYAELREALNCASTIQPSSSSPRRRSRSASASGAASSGCCMEIVQERLEREFNMELITTAPGVLYRVTTTDGAVIEVDNPAKLPTRRTSR
jgi:GTP-binding protein LepA